MLGEGNEPSLRGLALPVRPQNGKPFCIVTGGHALPPGHSLRSLGGPTSVIATPAAPGLRLVPPRGPTSVIATPASSCAIASLVGGTDLALP